MSESIAERLLRAISSNIDFTEPSSMVIESNRSLSQLKRRWDTLQALARARADLIQDSDVEMFMLSNSISIGTFNNALMRRVIKTNIPTSEEVHVNLEESWVQISMPIYEVLSVLTWIHWCTSEHIQVFPPAVSSRLLKVEIDKYQNDALVDALRQIAVLSAVNPTLWNNIVQVYKESLNDGMDWVYKNVYLYVGKNRNKDGVVSIAFPKVPDDNSVVDFAAISNGLGKLIEVTKKIVQQLGMSLGEYLQTVVNENGELKEEELDMDMSLNILDKLLRESVVVTKDGEVLNVTYDQSSGAISVTKRDALDPINTVDDRPIITHCKILVGDVEQDIVHLQNEELTNLVNSVHRVIEVGATPTPVNSGSTATILRAVPHPDAVVQQDGTVVPPQRAAATEGRRAPGLFETEPEGGWIPGDVRNTGNGYQIYNTVNLGGAAIGMWRAANANEIQRVTTANPAQAAVDQFIHDLMDNAPVTQTWDEDEEDDDMQAEPQPWPQDTDVDLDEIEAVDELDDPEETNTEEETVIPIITAGPGMEVAVTEEVPATEAVPAGVQFDERPPEDSDRAWMRLPNGRFVYL